MPTVTGTPGSDTLNGTNGDDVISGLGGNDILIDGAGADTLTGGDGADLFVFSAAGLGNVITDFQSGIDVIELGLLVPADFFEWLGTGEFTGTYLGEARYVNGVLEFDTNRDLVADLTIVINAPLVPSDFSTSGLIGYLGSGGVGQTVNGTTGPDNLLGDYGNDLLLGLSGNDWLNGGAGHDTMEGGDGDDHYVIDDPGDIIVESAGQGDDWLHSSVSYILAAGVSVETMTTMNGAGFTAINLSGNEIGQSIYGNAGNNLLNGGGGADYLVGQAGNDIYIVDIQADGLSEGAGQGDDWLISSSSYALASGVSIETMSTINGSSTAPINLTGNEFGQSLYGNAGANVLNGGGGIDYLVGLGGDDHYFVDNYADHVAEAQGEGDDWISTSVNYTLAPGSSIELLSATDALSTDNIFLGGNEFGQSIYGNAGENYIYGLGGSDFLVGLGGNDVLNGGQGNDYLMGGAGSDVFHFDNNGTIDTILDFDGSDYINLGSFLGIQQFQFIGSSAFTGWPGQGRFADGKFELDVNGDGIAELTVNVQGTIAAGQFVFWDDFY